MTNEWIDWSGDNRIRTPLRGGGCNNYLNNNYTSNKMTGMGLKVHSMMKSLQRPKGIYLKNEEMIAQGYLKSFL